jgi:hypothetical protein
MEINVLDLVGLIGLTIVVSVGKVLDPLREFLASFEHPWNPGRWLSALLSCSMCSGVWIGLIWALVVYRWAVADSILFAGIVSIVAFAVNEALGLFGILTLRVSRGMRMGEAGQPNVVALAEARSRAKAERKPKQIFPGQDITEEEAEALLDDETRRADEMVTPPPDEAA